MTEPAGTQVGFEETQVAAVLSFAETQGSQVVPDIMMIMMTILIMITIWIVMMMELVSTMLITIMMTSASAG